MLVIGLRRVLSEKAEREIIDIVGKEVEDIVIDFLQGRDRLNIKWKFHAPTIKKKLCGGCCND